MKTKFKAAEVLDAQKTYKEGTLEIDDETKEITVRVMDKRLFSKEEKTVATKKYATTDFPQFQNDEIPVGIVSVYITSAQDRQDITNILAKPLTEIKTRTIENIRQAEDAMKQMLETRATSLEYLAALRENPRKTLFSTVPDLTANNENPIEIATKQQKATISSAVAGFRENMITWIGRKLLNQATRDELYKIAISIGTAQDAIFQNKEADLLAADSILHSIGMTEPTVAGRPIKEVTTVLADELISKVHLTLVNNTVEAAKCEKCGKYFKVTPEGKCTYCHLGIGLG